MTKIFGALLILVACAVAPSIAIAKDDTIRIREYRGSVTLTTGKKHVGTCLHQESMVLFNFVCKVPLKPDGKCDYITFNVGCESLRAHAPQK